MSGPPPRILSIAGSDSSGGAGIQADIKTIAMLGGYAMTAITAVTAQNTLGVQHVETFSLENFTAQLDSCLGDIGVDAIKIGMLPDAAMAEAVLNRLAALDVPVVFDPVMVATSGSVLVESHMLAAFEKLMAHSLLVTPNLPELAALTGRELAGDEDAIEAALALAQRHDVRVLAKGGHGSGAEVIDRLVAPSGKIASFSHGRIDTRHTHGTGCTLSAAIATLLGHGQPLPHAVRLGREFTRAAIAHAPGFGSGNGPLGHQAVRTLA